MPIRKSRVSLSNPDFSPAFDRYLPLRLSGIAVDFERIPMGNSGLGGSEDFTLDLVALDEGRAFGRSDRGSTQIYRRGIDGARAVVKSVSLPVRIGCRQIATEIGNLFNLRHPLIGPLIGFAFPVESAGRPRLKTARLPASRGSLADVLANPPAWRTPTAKAKAVVRIALALRFAHGLGPLHGAVKAANEIFDADRRIQIAAFSSVGLETGEVEPFSGDKQTPAADVSAFVSLLSEIATSSPFPHRCSTRVARPRGRPGVCFVDDRGGAIARISVPAIVRRYRPMPELEPLRDCGGRRF
jgi:hypothetical protein